MRIELTNIDTIAFGRIFRGQTIGLFDFFIKGKTELPAVAELIEKKLIFFVTIFKQVITTGDFQIIGYKELSIEDNAKVPPQFTQDKVNIDDCIIFYKDDKIHPKKVKAVDCIGLEISSVWDSMHIIKRMEDFLLNKPNYSVEMGKVILSKEDLRYLPLPNTLKWDSEQGKLYKVS